MIQQSGPHRWLPQALGRLSLDCLEDRGLPRLTPADNIHTVWNICFLFLPEQSRQKLWEVRTTMKTVFGSEQWPREPLNPSIPSPSPHSPAKPCPALLCPGRLEGGPCTPWQLLKWPWECWASLCSGLAPFCSVLFSLILFPNEMGCPWNNSGGTGDCQQERVGQILGLISAPLLAKPCNPKSHLSHLQIVGDNDTYVMKLCNESTMY